MVVLTGQEPIFSDTIATGTSFGYYVTAVDVAGRESNPGPAAYPDGLPHSQPNTGGAAGADGLGGKDILPGGSSSPGAGSPTQKPDAAAKPAAPSGLKVTGKGVSVQLTWTANPKGDSVNEYTIYYSDTEDGTYKKLGTSTGTEFIYYAASDEGYYKLSAVNDKGESPLGKAVYFKK
jgi:penicillin-binding protein 1B